MSTLSSIRSHPQPIIFLRERTMIRESLHRIFRTGYNRGVGDARPHKLAYQFKEGDIISSRYQVEALIGWGSMGFVLKAYDQKEDRTVALKFLYAFLLVNDSVAYKRFQSEFDIAKNFDHPNLIKVYDYHTLDEKTQFISMEYIKGRDLAKALTDEALSMSEIYTIAEQIAAGLHYAHEKGVVHRDLKPENILIRSADDQIKLTDFGVAKLLEDERGLTRTGEGIGTPAYMSPEQFATSGEVAQVTPQSDIYSFGVILFELAEERLPFACKTYHAYFQAHAAGGEVRFSKLTRAPLWYQDMVYKALAKNPSKRQQNVLELQQTISLEKSKGGKWLQPFGILLLIIAIIIYLFFEG